MVLCVGEIILDMIGEDYGNGMNFDSHLGGAPLNVAYQIAKLKGESYFVGTVGDDVIGRYMTKEVEKLHLCGHDIGIDPTCNTTLAFVTLDHGERDFSFYRKNPADIQLPVIEGNLLKKAHIVHIGSMMLSFEYGYDYAICLVRRAKACGCLISFDANLRKDIYQDEFTAKERSMQLMELSDIVKLSKDEADFFSMPYIEEIAKERQVFITDGKKGSMYLNKKIKIKAKTYPVAPVDTTGAGDSFYGAILSMLDEGRTDIKDMLEFANACGAMSTRKKGAMASMPSYEEAIEFLQQQKQD